MKLATRATAHPDGELLVVSKDLSQCVRARGAATMQQALDRRQEIESSWQGEYTDHLLLAR